MSDAAPRIVTVPKLKRLLGMDRPVERALAEGELAYIPGGWRRVFLADAISWAEARRVLATPHAKARVEEVLAREREAS